MERLNYIYNNGKQICVVDLSGCSDKDLFQAIEDVKKTIKHYILTDKFNNVSLKKLITSQYGSFVKYVYISK